MSVSPPKDTSASPPDNTSISAPTLTAYHPEGCTDLDSGELDIEGIEINPGQKVVSIPIRIQKAPNPLLAIGIKVTYDPSVLEYSDFTNGELVESFSYFACSLPTPGKLTIGGFDVGSGIPQDSNGYVGWINFKVVGGAVGECYPLNLIDLADDIEGLSSSGACLCIQDCNGDINGDGVISPQDALSVFNCIQGSDSCNECVDVNKDGEVTEADGLCLLWKYLELPSCLSQPEETGCMDPAATNYNPDATLDDGSCTYPLPPPSIAGCMDPAATNYNPDATLDDGSCTYPLPPPSIAGCMDPAATNYNPDATLDDGSCTYPLPPPSIAGCMDPAATNYNPDATLDDGSCVYLD
ncbi:MAG: cohesin domain-containing protein [bacterium]